MVVNEFFDALETRDSAQREAALLAALPQQVDGTLHVPLRFPVGCEGRRLVGDADVFGEDRQDRTVELAVDGGERRSEPATAPMWRRR